MTAARYLAWMIWRLVRLPLLALLILLEPFVRTILSGVSLLGIVSTLVFKTVASSRGFPLWGTLTLSLGCMMVLMGYYTVIRALLGR
jgi:hypothetical protein